MIPLPLCLGFHGRFWLNFKVVRRLKEEKKIKATVLGL